MVLTPDLLARLDAAVALYGAGEPSTCDEIEEAVSGLDVVLDPGYVEVVGRHGGCFVGVPVHGLCNASPLEDTDVAALTRAFRADGWAVADEGLVIGFDGSGNPLVITNDGPVVTFDHDTGERHTLAETFADLLDQNLPDLPPTGPPA
ncbi:MULTISPECIES: SMI1/KNR4 family protein [Oerskovia]|uniref:SMI1/KNR4 family protein n=1 Tax=Oerskovia rustica TaxID=2762237 RepID=A0ABR8RNX4_9CELL|nr:SMI1/KNR4 family protein [Oerskovia rustica]MBD7949463.1 SMI1/KNR4 family protein [Oerskovia rustica]